MLTIMNVKPVKGYSEIDSTKNLYSIKIIDTFA
jgi:hypothetical protein